MKNIFFASTALATAAFISAASAESAAPTFAGPHAGITLGGHHLSGEFSSDEKLNAGGVDNQKVNLGKGGVAGGITVGLNKFFNDKFFGGLEAFGYYASGEGKSTMKANATSYTDSLKAKIKNGFGVDAKLGTLINSTLAFVRVGVDYAAIEIKGEDNATTFKNAPKKSKRRAGLRLGLGTETKLNDKVSVGLDYVYTHYGQVKAADKANGATRTTEIKFKPTDHKVLLSLKYYFKG